MNHRQSPFNNAAFWQRQLEQGGVWRGVFVPRAPARFPLYVNSVIVDRQRDVYHCDWASFPNAHATLGFVQYVFLPTVFYAQLHPEESRLHTPVGPTEVLGNMLARSGHEQAADMARFLKMAAAWWPLCECRLTRALLALGEMLADAFGTPQKPVRLNLYPSAPAICNRVRLAYHCEEVFEKDTGMDLPALSALCRMAQQEPLYRALLMRFLNSRMAVWI